MFKLFVWSNTGCKLTDHTHDLSHGIDCNESENCTFQMTRLVHKSFRETQKNISRDKIFKACTFSTNSTYEFEMCDCQFCFFSLLKQPSRAFVRVPAFTGPLLCKTSVNDSARRLQGATGARATSTTRRGQGASYSTWCSEASY